MTEKTAVDTPTPSAMTATDAAANAGLPMRTRTP